MTEATEKQVVMTPKGKTANSTTLLIERRAIKSTSDKMHIAGGEHTGIVINKEAVTDRNDQAPPKVTLEFRVFLVSGQTGKHTQESRTLPFWFSTGDDSTAQDFFRELVAPQEFPRVSGDEYTIGNVVLLSVEKVLELIESTYPNPITLLDLAKHNNWDEEEVAHHLAELQSCGLVKAMDHGAFTRQQSLDTQVTVAKQMPRIASSKQPTIAIITAQYCEKLAVDAMIENKEKYIKEAWFVRY